MGNSEVLLNKIYRNLDFFAKEVKRNTAGGRTEILGNAESIFRELLNLMYGFNLQSVNAYDQDLPGVDLIDKATHTAVQITAINTSAKIRDSMRKYEEHRIYETCRNFWVLILEMKPISNRMRELRASQYELKLMTLSTLYDEIGLLSAEKLDKISKHLANSIGVNEDRQEKSGPASPISSGGALAPTQRQVLALASLLPEDGLEQRVFTHGLVPDQRMVVPNLIQRGLLYTKDGSVLCIHHDIRAEYQDELCFSGIDHTYFLDRLWHYDKCWHWDRVTLKERNDIRCSLAQLFSSASRLLPDPQHIYARRSAELWLLAPQYASALQEGQRILAAYAFPGTAELEIARASDFVGDCYCKLGKHPEALQAWQETLDLCQSLHVSESELATALHKVGCAHLELKQNSDAKIYLMQELQIRETLRRSQKFVPDLPGLADMYAKLSAVFSNMGNSQSELLCSANALRAPAEMHFLWEKLSPRLDLPVPATFHASDFIGREECLREIRDRFLSGDKVVVLNGLGGSGKTALAVRCALEWMGSVYFIPFDTSFTQTLANMAHGIRPALRPEELCQSADVLCQMVLDLLKDAGDHDMLIIDNVEHATKSFSDLQKDPGYRVLTDLRLRLLLTTRSDVPRPITVSNLPEESLFEIFRRHGAPLSEQEMRSLIHTVNGHTMTVDLIARTLNGRGLRKITAEEMQKALQERTLPGVEYPAVGSDYDRSPGQAQIYHHLRAVFIVSGMTEISKNVMRYATLLPKNGMYGELFGHALTEEEQHALDALLDGGWLKIQNDLITIHPIIRLICREELEPNDGSCKHFLSTLEKQWDRTLYDPVMDAQLAEVFSLASDQLEDLEAQWIIRGGYFLNTISHYEEARALCENHLTDLESRLTGHPNLAAVYLNLGFAHGKLGSHAAELEFLLKALDILKAALPEDHPELAACYDNIGATYRELGDHKNAFDFTMKALEIREMSPSTDKLDLARSYRNLGSVHDALGDHQQALIMKQKAMGLYEQILPQDHPELAACWDDIGVTYRKLDKHKDAFDFTVKALEIREKCLPPDHPDLAISYHHAGCSYSEQGDYSKALECLRKALAIQKLALPADHPDLAQSHSTVGIFYSDLGDDAQALEYLRKALEIYERILPPVHPVLSASYRNVGEAYEALGDTENAWEYFRKAEQSEP